MSTSRRDFMKASLAAGVAVAAGQPAAAQHRAESSVVRTEPAKAVESAEFTRGVGVYPGAAQEDFGPTLVPAGQEYRNLALLRPAYHSSSYDYNLTAQLITDGIVHTRMPETVSVSVDGRLLAKPDREVVLDHFESTLQEVIGARPVVQIHLNGHGDAPSLDRVRAFLSVPRGTDRKTLRFTVYGSADGYLWEALGHAGAPEPVSAESYPPDLTRENTLIAPVIMFARPQTLRYYRLQLEVLGASPAESSFRWGVGEVQFFHGDQRIEVGGPYSFTSAWKSNGLAEEWVYVDLGTVCAFDLVSLHWIASAAEGKLQVSNDAMQWRDVGALHGLSTKEDVRLPAITKGRYVRVLMTKPSTADGYVLSELEVFGRGGLRPQAKAAAAADPDGTLHLAGGNWRVQRADLVAADGDALSQMGFNDKAWIVATVPGTVLTSYLNAGALPDPNYGQNQLYISDSFFYSDFWYRTEFEAQAATPGELQWLEFAGINWKANVFLNGEKLGRIEGAFQRARYNVTGKLKVGKPNALAVVIEKNATPGSVKQKTFESPARNGGALGADNPTFHSSVGWDWIPTIRGRNIGIWNTVRLVKTGLVTVSNPAVTTLLPKPDNSRADVSLSAMVKNHANSSANVAVKCVFGEITLQQEVSLAGGEEKQITFTPETHDELSITNPRLWWPAGYGEPHLYDVTLSASDNPRVLKFKAGLRQVTASEGGGALRLWVNGRRIVAKGGNWGFSESMLRYRAREYDAAVRYHREMNFNMIRNWVGQIGEDAFYEACDRYGILVWQDFWLANPWDGPIPNDNTMFLNNARDLLLKIRMHPCIGVYCGRNEWFPPKPLDDGLRALLKELQPELHYIGSSADGPVSGHGPYQALSPQTYFSLADSKLHSEIGSPNIPPYESARMMMSEPALWPQALEWGMHDFCMKGAQGGESFRSIVEQGYGDASDAKEWIELAQFVNYDTYRAMFEAQGKDRMGVLLWMSHSCWPSFVWQTYDYYLAPTAAYFACKKACEPIHIQWNSLTEMIEVVNVSGGDQVGLSAKLQIINSDGSLVATQTSVIDSHEDSTGEVFPITYPNALSSVHFVRLTLLRGETLLSTNTYLRGREIGDFRGIRALGKAHLAVETQTQRAGDQWKLSTSIRNTSQVPALAVRAQVIRAQTGDRIVPAIFSDGYVTLMPGERLDLKTELQHADTRGEKPRVMISGYNVTVSG